MKGNGALEITHNAAVVASYDHATQQWTFGGAAFAQFVALANLVDARLSALKTILTGWTVTPGDGGAALQTAMNAWSTASVAATKLKGS